MKHQSIGLSVLESEHPFGDLPFDGLVGLGFPDTELKESKKLTPIFDSIRNQVPLTYSTVNRIFNCYNLTKSLIRKY